MTRNQYNAQAQQLIENGFIDVLVRDMEANAFRRFKATPTSATHEVMAAALVSAKAASAVKMMVTNAGLAHTSEVVADE